MELFGFDSFLKLFILSKCTLFKHVYIKKMCFLKLLYCTVDRFIVIQIMHTLIELQFIFCNLYAICYVMR